MAVVWEHRRSGSGNPQNVINLGNFFDWKEQNTVFEDMAAFFDFNVNMTGNGEPEEIPGQVATTNLFSVLRVQPIYGRTFAPDDGQTRWAESGSDQPWALATSLRCRPADSWPQRHAKQSAKHNHRCLAA